MTATLIRWLIFLHVLSALTFYMAHGASATMAFKIRKETDFTRIRAMLDLSNSTMIMMFLSFAVMGLPYRKGSKELPAEPPSSPEEVATLLKKTSVTGLVVVGYVIPAFVLWLMVFK